MALPPQAIVTRRAQKRNRFTGKFLTIWLVICPISCYNQCNFCVGAQCRHETGENIVGGYLQNLWESLNFTSIGAMAERVVAVLLCLTVHETCHGLAALALGDPTARNLHRLSFNPLRHIDWLGLVMMFTAGFGWAKPVPVDPRYFRNPKWGMALTSLAGPASNFVLAALSLALARATYAVAPQSPLVLFFLYSLPMLSLGLGFFNLLPFPPLDGSKVVAALLPDALYVRWMRYEQFGMLVLFAAVLLGWNFNFIGKAVYWLYLLLLSLVF